MSAGLNGHQPIAPDCTRYAEALPRLWAGTLAPEEGEALRRHLFTCPSCQARRAEADGDTLNVAVRRHYGVPAGRAPILRLEDVLDRVAAEAPTAPAPPAPPAPPEIPTIRSTREIPPMRTDAPDTFNRTTTAAPRAPRAPRDPHDPHDPRGPGRGRVAAAIAMVAAIAALFALILHAAAPGSSVSQKGAAPTATAAPAVPRYLGANGAWETRAQAHVGDFGSISASSSDPHVLYKTPADGTLGAQRSDDGGKTWTDLSLPRDDVGDTRANVSLSVSPLDARTVFAIIGSDENNPKCPRPAFQAAYSPNSGGGHIGALAALRPQSGGYSCTFEYVSTDGGATWHKPQTPEKGDIGEAYAAPFQAQDGRLYSLLNPDINGPADQGHRLLTGTDGLHWQAADAQLFAQGQHVYEFAATPTGTTLFATTIPVNTYGGDAAAHRQFWRSDDVGASWRNLGVFPNTRSDSQDTWLAAAALVDGKVLVYYSTSQPLPSQGGDQVAGPSRVAIPTVHVSADNGQTWQASPSAGLPAGQGSPGMPVGVLPDGTVAETFATESNVSTGPNSFQTVFSDLAFYGWKPGASSWTQLTPVIHGPMGSVHYIWLDQPIDAHPAGVWTLVYDGGDVKLEYCRLTA